MAERRTKIHYIYKITHIKSGKYYVGMHSTFDMDDGYMGSGKLIIASVNKYGVEAHTKEILAYANSRKGLVELEAELVTENIVSDKLCLNMKNGGHGGFAGEKHKKKFLVAGKKKRKINQTKRRIKKRVANRKAKKRIV
jgi:hypothetical protein